MDFHASISFHDNRLHVDHMEGYYGATHTQQVTHLQFLYVELVSLHPAL